MMRNEIILILVTFEIQRKFLIKDLGDHDINSRSKLVFTE